MDGFSTKNLRLAKYEEDPIKALENSSYTVYKIPIIQLTRRALEGKGMRMKEMDRCKNMFVLGFIYWLYSKSLTPTEDFLKKKFQEKKQILESNIEVLRKGFYYGETIEAFEHRYEVRKASMPKGTYRNIKGNQAISLGLITAAKQAGLPLFYAGYPITPASEILHELAKHKNFGVKTFQAEDEISAICAAIGASFAGNLGVTGSSGPGISLKAEAMGLAVMLELPLVICNIQRGGPSTGLPTKTEQADLLQALYGRHGECPIPVIATRSPSHCFTMAIEATRIAIQYMTPVILLSDGYIAHAAEPWCIPKVNKLPKIKVEFCTKKNDEDQFLPYLRNQDGVRPWAIPGTPECIHIIGGLEKENGSGNISYQSENHALMVEIRKNKVENIPVPNIEFSVGNTQCEYLILSWGSTYGAVKGAAIELNQEGYSTAHLHVDYLYPLPPNLKEILHQFKNILIPEMNTGQLQNLIQARFLIPTYGLHKVKGVPFKKKEIKEAVQKM